MARETWRDSVRPRIAKVIEEVGRSDMKALRAALRKAYPWGERAHFPYRIWCDEVNVQLGIKKERQRQERQLADAAAGQGLLFESQS